MEDFRIGSRRLPHVVIDRSGVGRRTTPRQAMSRSRTGVIVAHRISSGSGVCIRSTSGIASRKKSRPVSAWSGAPASEHRAIAEWVAVDNREAATHLAPSPGHGRHRAPRGFLQGGTPRPESVGTGLTHGLRRALTGLFGRFVPRRATLIDPQPQMVWTITVHPTVDDWL